MSIVRSIRCKIEPDPKQEIRFRQFSGVCRMIYNLALEQREIWGRSHRINFASQCRELTRLRLENDWVKDVFIACEQQALRDLERAFVNFYSGRAFYPKPHKRGVNDNFRFPGREIEIRRLNSDWSSVRLPKIGWVKFRNARVVQGIVTVRLSESGTVSIRDYR